MINRVVLVGRLTRDPELRKTNSGGSVASFTVAVDNRTKNPDGTRGSSFIPCSVFNQQADNVAKFVRKGSLVGVEGRLNQRSFVRKDGTNAQVIEVLADSVQFLEPKSASTAQAPVAEVDSFQDTSFDDNDNSFDGLNLPENDLPF